MSQNIKIKFIILHKTGFAEFSNEQRRKCTLTIYSLPVHKVLNINQDVLTLARSSALRLLCFDKFTRHNYFAVTTPIIGPSTSLIRDHWWGPPKLTLVNFLFYCLHWFYRLNLNWSILLHFFRVWWWFKPDPKKLFTKAFLMFIYAEFSSAYLNIEPDLKFNFGLVIYLKVLLD